MSMSKSLVLRLACALTPGLALALLAGVLFGDIAPLPKAVALASVLFASIGYSVFVIQRLAVAPLKGDVPPDVEFGVAAAPWPA